MLTIVDYGLGNLGSILNMLRRLGHEAAVAGDGAGLDRAGGVILPGVGAFDTGMQNLRRRGLLGALGRVVLERRIPALGICLGAQLMTRRSEEGQEAGLGWVDADTVRFSRESAATMAMKVPAMGWQDVRIESRHWLTDALDPEPRFYFVHSYHFRCDRPEEILLTAEYGYRFAAAFARDNVVGVQFHPEKSHRHGMRVLDAFARHVAGQGRSARV